MKKVSMMIAALVAIVAIMTFLLGTGFIKRNDITLRNYSISPDGSKLSFTVDVTSSIGNTRGFVDNGGGVKPHYLTFYSAYGGFNSKLGAREDFTLKLEEDDTEIYFNRPDKGYELVLRKNPATGKWERP